MMAEEWGPWIEHDGRSCPDIVGLEAEVVVERDECLPRTRPGDVDHVVDASWLWAFLPSSRRVVQYRVRRPGGMTVLEAIPADLPEEVDA